MEYINKKRIAFDFDFFKGTRRESYDKLVQIVCSAHWGSGIDIFGRLNQDHPLLFEFVMKDVIVIDECEYKIKENSEHENAWLIKSLLGKRSNHPVLQDMATLFANEPFEASRYYRNTIYIPNLKAFVRADGMKPENVVEMLSLDDCDKIILFPYFPLDDKTAYYEITLAVDKKQLADYLKCVEEQRYREMNEAIRQAEERTKAGYRSVLRLEEKSDWKVVEQITYRAFRDAPPTGADDDGMEALLARKLRSRAAFVPELDYVAELDGKVIGNIMYTRSRVVGESVEWETLIFGPVSVLPKYQGQGVGGALIRKSLDTARELGYRAVLIFGHESYYPRFGFKPALEFGITTADGRNFPAFMALPLYEGALDGVHGRLVYDETIDNLDREESDKLNTKLAEPMDIEEYIDAQPEDIQKNLRLIHTTIRKALPDAREKISQSMPTYTQGRSLIKFAAKKSYISVYLGEEAMVHFAPQLRKYKKSKNAIQFPYNDFIGEHLPMVSEITAWLADSENQTEN